MPHSSFAKKNLSSYFKIREQYCPVNVAQYKPGVSDLCLFTNVTKRGALIKRGTVHVTHHYNIDQHEFCTVSLLVVVCWLF